MKKIFGFYNNCYWMIFGTFEEAKENSSKFTMFDEQYFKQVFARGQFVFVNRNGGFHGGDIDEKKDIIASEGFPTNKQRLEYLEAIVELRIDEMCKDLGMTREEVLAY